MEAKNWRSACWTFSFLYSIVFAMEIKIWWSDKIYQAWSAIIYFSMICSVFDIACRFILFYFYSNHQIFVNISHNSAYYYALNVLVLGYPTILLGADIFLGSQLVCFISNYHSIDGIFIFVLSKQWSASDHSVVQVAFTQFIKSPFKVYINQTYLSLRIWFENGLLVWNTPFHNPRCYQKRILIDYGLYYIINNNRLDIWLRSKLPNSNFSYHFSKTLGQIWTDLGVLYHLSRTESHMWSAMSKMNLFSS